MASILHSNKRPEIRRGLLNPNEDDLEHSTLEDLSKLVEHTIKAAKKRCDNTKEECDDIKFVGDVEALKPTKLDIPKSQLNPEDFKASIYNNPMVKILNTLTSETVIKAAARELLNK